MKSLKHKERRSCWKHLCLQQQQLVCSLLKLIIPVIQWCLASCSDRVCTLHRNHSTSLKVFDPVMSTGHRMLLLRPLQIWIQKYKKYLYITISLRKSINLNFTNAILDAADFQDLCIFLTPINKKIQRMSKMCIVKGHSEIRKCEERRKMTIY